MYHGQGSIMHASGVTYEGMWINGTPAGKTIVMRFLHVFRGAITAIKFCSTPIHCNSSLEGATDLKNIHVPFSSSLDALSDSILFFAKVKNF